MARFPTNTLILTNVSDDMLKDPSLLIKFLAKDNHTCELISLNRFGRILLICNNTQISLEIKLLLENDPQWKSLKVSFSMQDNELSDDLSVGNRTDYLELPSEDGSRRFLISPPLSPPPEWDHWDKVEEGPNKKAVYDPEELSHLLWERLGGIESTEVRKYETEKKRDLKIEPQVLFEDIKNDVPAIVLDKIDDDNDRPNIAMHKTPMPPL